MLSKDVMAIMVDPYLEKFESVANELYSCDDFGKQLAEAVILTWHGCSLKIPYDGTVDGFLHEARAYLDRFDVGKFAEELEREKGFRHNYAIDIAAWIRHKLTVVLRDLNDSDSVFSAIAVQRAGDTGEYGLFQIEEADNGKPTVSYSSGRGYCDLDEEQKDDAAVFDVPLVLACVKGKEPKKKDLDELNKFLKGKTTDEEMRMLKMFADLTGNAYYESLAYRIRKESKENDT